MAEDRRPIRIVIPDANRDYSSPRGGGGGKLFPMPKDWPEQLVTQITKVEKTFNASLAAPQSLPAVARVKLKPEAMAKSHRPFALFDDTTWPVIGGEGLGEMLVSVRASAAHPLRRAVRKETKEARRAISTIRAIEPFSTSSPIAEDAANQSKIRHRPGALKVRLFDHGDERLNLRIDNAFLKLLAAHKVEPRPLRYASALRLYSVPANNAAATVALSEFVGTQSIDVMPEYGVETQALAVADLPDDALPLPVKGVEYPIVGLLDSGINRSNKRLEAWVVGRDEEDVPPDDQDNRHGTFIAGLLINARGLNHNDPRFPAVRCKIFDAVVFPKTASGTHAEEDLIHSIRRVIAAHHKTVKVWNLSISSVKNACSDGCFSHLAMTLDEIQDQYDVTIVTCTGNLKDHLLRPWPCKTETLGELDRMFPASDSVRAISVASCAHKDAHDSLAKQGDPSPFSRRGPGPAFHPKPELSHLGGNCNSSGRFHQMGVLSIDPSPALVERVGTSYAAPLVASVFSGLRHNVARPMSRNVAKALMIQSAVIGGNRTTADQLRYRGFGIPSTIDELLDSPPWRATLVFEPQFDTARRIFAMQEFPIPNSFRRQDGKVEGEFIMTLVYDPPLLANAGAEYCRVNVEVSLGTYDKGKKGKPDHKGKIPLEPADVKTLYEEYQLEHGFKWSPVKVFRKRLDGVQGKMWRIRLQAFYRTEQEQQSAELVQGAALVVTLQDPSKPNVYDDVIQALNRSRWSTEELSLRPRQRIRGR